ncbi:hypothetical protein [Legionella bozemanae]|uniref:hypothetical protein n=1 Tax=Legionella bozemanae TaxID=447 RepID=UPI0010411A1D|nr:hypothetical protein [Legionella bozemanae]
MHEISYHYESDVKQAELDVVEKGHITAEAENGIVCNYALFYIADRNKENHLVGLLTLYTLQKFTWKISGCTPIIESIKLGAHS